MKRALIMFSMVLFGICLFGCSETPDVYKDVFKRKIDLEIKSKSNCDYTLENWNEIMNISRDGKAEIDQSTDYENAETIYLLTISKINWILTISETIYPMVGEEKYTIGNGTKEDPFMIDTVGKLIYFSNQINNGENTNSYFALGANIDLVFQEWIPIGVFSNCCFNGVFDGNGYEIKNLNISKRHPNSDVKNIGLFGYNFGTIRNLGVTNIDIDLNWQYSKYELPAYAGGIAGNNMGCIENCYTMGEVNLEYYSGHTSTVPADMRAGGIVGINSGQINNCYSTMDLSIKYVGRPTNIIAAGIATYCNSIGEKGEINNCLATGNISTEYDFPVSNRECEEVSIGYFTTNCYAYEGQIIELGVQNPCTEKEINTTDFYTSKLGWDPNIWDLKDLNFSNGKYNQNQYPKLKINR